MPLRLNLYHELHLQKKQKAYDPLKITFLVLIVTASVMAVYYFSILREKMAAVSTLKNKVAEYKELTIAETAAKTREVELNTQISNADFLVERMEKRFYWPGFLEELSKSITPKIQITTLNADAGKETNKVMVTIEGVIGSVEHPRISAGDFLKTISQKFSSKYKKVEVKFREGSIRDTPNTITLKTGEILKTATYTLEVQFATKD